MNSLGLNATTQTIRVKNAVAAGTSDITDATIIDTANASHVKFIVGFGALTATQVTSIRVQHSDAADMAGAADIVGAVTSPLADSDGNKMLEVELTGFTKQFVRLVIDRGTANAVVDFALAILTLRRLAPSSLDSTVKQSVYVGDCVNF